MKPSKWSDSVDAFVLGVYRLTRRFPDGEVLGEEARTAALLLVVALEKSEGEERGPERVSLLEESLGKAMVIQCLLSIARRVELPLKDDVDATTATDSGMENLERRAGRLVSELDGALQKLRSGYGGSDESEEGR